MPSSLMRTNSSLWKMNSVMISSGMNKNWKVGNVGKSSSKHPEMKVSKLVFYAISLLRSSINLSSSCAFSVLARSSGNSEGFSE